MEAGGWRIEAGKDQKTQKPKKSKKVQTVVLLSAVNPVWGFPAAVSLRIWFEYIGGSIFVVKKSFNEKLQHSGDLPKVESIAGTKQGERLQAQTMLIAAPREYDALMKLVPPGYLTTIDRMMAHLAKEHQAETACPMTAGIFVNIAAKASEERLGMDETPYWRTLKKGGELSEKYPGGLEGQRQKLEEEGHRVTQRGKRLFVQDYEQKLFSFCN